ncbi:hypothetical protein ABH940_006840 [Streptacidiphilus sp. BW17]
MTSDDGLHWQVSQTFPTPTDPSRMPRLSLRTEDCVPGAPEHCYRVVPGHALVQETRDAGRHWFTAWQLSAGRELFLRRSGGYAEDTTGARLHLDSTSLVVLLVAAGHVVIVADQNDGLVVRTADGRWPRTGLAQQPPDSTIPVPVTGLGAALARSTCWPCVPLGWPCSLESLRLASAGTRAARAGWQQRRRPYGSFLASCGWPRRLR